MGVTYQCVDCVDRRYRYSSTLALLKKFESRALRGELFDPVVNKVFCLDSNSVVNKDYFGNAFVACGL